MFWSYSSSKIKGVSCAGGILHASLVKQDFLFFSSATSLVGKFCT